jgi:hypothetical protein
MSGLTAAQICQQARAMAKCPSFNSQSGQLLNMILADLCQTYDFQLARKTTTFNFNTALVDPTGRFAQGAGPYALPTDFLRCQDDMAVFWVLQGVPYPMIPLDLSEMDMTVQTAGLAAYPYWFATDLSGSDETAAGASGPIAYVYPPPSGNYPVTVRYFAQMADITAPETSATVPWFPNQAYLLTRLAGELMRLTDDERYATFLGEGPEGAQGILDRYLKLKDDRSNRAQRVKLDRRRFGNSFSTLPNTKTVGW